MNSSALPAWLSAAHDLVLVWVAWLSLNNSRRLRAQELLSQERLTYLLRNAEELGGVRSANELLTGQLATLAAKLDRQIELTRLYP